MSDPLDKTREVGGLINGLRARIPEGDARDLLIENLYTALDRARAKDRNAMQDAVQSVWSAHNVLSTKGVDVLTDVENIVDKIREIAA